MADTVVEPFGRTVIEIGDDEADVEAEPRRLGTSNGASFAIPGFGSMSLLGVTPHDIFVVERAFSANGVGRLIDLSRRRLCAGKVCYLASGLFRERAAGRLALALRRFVGRHIGLRLVFVRLRFLIFLIASLSLRHGYPPD